jgi:hypothetical protein
MAIQRCVGVGEFQKFLLNMNIYKATLYIFMFWVNNKNFGEKVWDTFARLTPGL